MTLWSYTVTYVSTSTDITSYVTEVPTVLIPTNMVRACEITLRCPEGAFLTDANSGATPLLAKWDKIKIDFTDRDSNTESHIFEIDTRRPIKDSAGTKLIISGFGQERHLQNMPYSESFQAASAFDVIKDIAETYNDNKGSSQAAIENHDDTSENEAPQWTANFYDFSDSPTCWQAIMRVLDQLGASVANGGAAEFPELVFSDKTGDATVIEMKVFDAGSKPASPVTVQNVQTTPVTLTNGTEENETGNVIVGAGANGFGSLPKDYSKHWARVEQFQLHPVHQTGLTYPANAYVQLSGTHYKSNQETQNAPGHADWDTVTEADVISTVPPSPWTYKKAALWENCGSNPTGNAGGSGTGFDQEGMWDSNLVVKDEDHYRNWVHLREIDTAAIDSTYLYGGTDAYSGLRLLVDSALGTLAGAFAQNSGNDRFGNAYSDAFVKHNGGTETGSTEYKNWDVFRSASADDVCSVMKEGKNYLFSGGSWADDSGNARRNDCFHIYDATAGIANDTGVSTISKQKGDSSYIDLDGDGSPDTGETYGTDSAVTVTYAYTPWSSVTFGVFTSTNFYSIGAWLNFMLPFPPNTNNAITENLAELYGGDVNNKQPTALDAAGFFGLTPTGQSGWNKSDSEEQGPLDALEFFMKLKWTDQGTGDLINLQSNFKMRCIAYDDSDNVVFQDFEILDNNRWEFQSLPISGFKPYLARLPLSLKDTPSNIILPELEVLQRFEWKNVRMICFQTQDSYDDAGRYSPEGNNRFVTALPLGSTKQIELSIDAFHFAKQLVTTTGTEATRAIIPQFVQRPEISNYEQLKADIQAEKEIQQFEYRAYEIEQEGRNDITPGQSFFLKDSKVINDSDDVANTIKLVAKEIKYRINGTDGGTGGYKRTILGVKRLS